MLVKDGACAKNHALQSPETLMAEVCAIMNARPFVSSLLWPLVTSAADSCYAVDSKARGVCSSRHFHWKGLVQVSVETGAGPGKWVLDAMEKWIPPHSSAKAQMAHSNTRSAARGRCVAERESVPSQWVAYGSGHCRLSKQWRKGQKGWNKDCITRQSKDILQAHYWGRPASA